MADTVKASGKMVPKMALQFGRKQPLGGCPECRVVTSQEPDNEPCRKKIVVFEFVGSLNDQAKQVGNAVSVPLAKAVGEEFLRLARSKTRGAA